jgi:hypothetical protein
VVADRIYFVEDAVVKVEMGRWGCTSDCLPTVYPVHKSNPVDP